MRALFEDILYERRTDPVTLPVRFVLRCLSVIYRIIISTRNSLYTRHILKTRAVPCRVVSIGNLTVGGTGKTPVVIMTARFLLNRGYTVAVVSRGYRRQGKESFIISDGVSLAASPIESGDEAHIIDSALPGVPVVVGADRYRAAQLAYDRFRPNVLLLDDAFQHRRLYRDVDVVTLDAHNPYGNGRLLPRGILRESPYSISRAKAVIVTRYHEGLQREKIDRMIRFYERTVPIFFSRHIPSGLREAFHDADEDTMDMIQRFTKPQELNGVRIAALSNIACPDSFLQMLESLGSDVVFHRVMEDHHRYIEQELDGVQSESINAGAEILVITAKDERNLPDGYKFKIIQAYVLDIEAELLENEDKFVEIIKP